MKRLIINLGSKGGVGKTLFCRQMYYFLNRYGKKCLAIDADKENPQFHEFHRNGEHQVDILEILKTEGTKNLLTRIYNEKPDVVLIDMPAASGSDLRTQLTKFSAFDVFDKLEYRISVVAILNRHTDTINSLSTMAAYCGSRVDYVVVKNQYFGNSFSHWEESETRQNLPEGQYVEVLLPELDESAFDYLSGDKTPFFAIEQIPNFGDKLLVQSFLTQTEAEMTRAGQFLGFDTNSEPAKSSRSRGKRKPDPEEVAANEQPAPAA